MARPFYLFLLATTFAVPTLARGASLKDLVMDAIALPAATSQGQIDGEEAKVFRRLLGTDLPVRATVTRVMTYRQEGCGRLKIELEVPGKLVKRQDGQSQPMASGFQMDMCLDGQAPTDKRPA